MPHIGCMKTVCLGNLLLKLQSKMLIKNQIAGFFKLSHLKNYFRYNVLFLHVVRYPWNFQLNLVIFAGFGQACPRYSKITKQQYLWEDLSYFVYLLHVVTHPSGPFRGFSMRVWQNACVNTVRHAVVCDVFFPFSKIL